MPRFRIRGALGGGFGGVKNAEWQITHAKDLDEAMEEARQLAIEEYESYAGMHGLREIGEIMEQDGVDEDEAQSIYNEEMESWLDFEAEPISEHEERKG